MVSIIIKFQRCGKKNCRCSKEGKLHGPYFWAVSYKGSRQGRVKYKWVYLGKTVDTTLENVAKRFPEMHKTLTPKELQIRLTKLHERSSQPQKAEHPSLVPPQLHIPIPSEGALRSRERLF